MGGMTRVDLRKSRSGGSVGDGKGQGTIWTTGVVRTYESNTPGIHICIFRAAAGGGYVKAPLALGIHVKENAVCGGLGFHRFASSGFKVYHRQFSCIRAKLIIEN